MKKIPRFIYNRIIKPLENAGFRIAQWGWRYTPDRVKRIGPLGKLKSLATKEKKTFKDKLILWGIVLLIAFVGWKIVGPKKVEEEFIEAKVKSGEVTSKVSVTGKVSSEYEVDLSFGSSGTIERIVVEEGEAVKEGDFLAAIDTTVLEAQIKQAKGSIQSANANLEKLQRGYDVAIAQQQSAISQADLELSQKSLENTIKTNEQDFNIAKNKVDQSNQSVASSQEQLHHLESTTGQDVMIASLQEEKADEYESNLGRAGVDRGTRKNAEFDHEIAQEQKVKAEMSRQQQIDQQKSSLLDLALKSDDSRSSLESTKVKAEVSTDTAENQVVKSSGQASLTELQLQQIVANKPSDVKSLRGQILQSQGTLEQAEDALEKAKLYAPFEGTIITINGEVGEMNSSAAGSFVTVADLEHLQIEVDVSETDIVAIAHGQKVLMDFDAVLGEIFEGVVSKINPGPVEIQGVVNYKVTITFKSDERIKLGMTANIEIITGEEDNSLYVPIRAIFEEDDIEFVRVKKGNKITKKEVKLGIQGDTTVEILEGVEEGDTVVF